MKFNKITIAGGGVLGAQIAFQSAFHGYEVMVYDISEEAIENTKTFFKRIGEAFITDLNASEAQVNEAINRISTSISLPEAVEDADFVIEAIPENPTIKTEFYQQLGKLAPAKTIFATNTSTLLPSQFADATGRPEQFLALHFANEIWKRNTAEIMGHDRTDKKVFNQVVDFAKSIGMVALPLNKEQPKYIVNTLLVSLLNAGLELWGKEVADIHTIDKTWTLSTGAPFGPFAMMDVIGINTVYQVNQIKANETKDPIDIKIVDKLKEMVEANELGTATGKGFYSYPNPAYKDKDFLK
ncbi:3-hydroxyacyl-CoA dehydrogenase [Crocinitomix algicola]|uniref:3-hydroxyacyl-CoA dehydrogenase n=1 Tax=Crocinitomix algicola TaxID=1740263 RepID=UPI000871F1D5|nr:3-hydroxyacyl-CoA dehydrogenase [Crocinitomix algicola]